MKYIQPEFDFKQRFVFSPREEYVLRGLVNCKTLEQMACELGLNVKTVKDYAASIRKKMCRPSMVGAASLAVQQGLVRCNEEK